MFSTCRYRAFRRRAQSIKIDHERNVMDLPMENKEKAECDPAGIQGHDTLRDTRRGASRERKPLALVLSMAMLSLIAFASLGWHSPVLAAGPERALLLVARPAVSDPLYGRSIVVAREMPDGRYVGFILNKPTQVTVTEAFPGHDASVASTEPIYIGGVSSREALFALVNGQPEIKDGTFALTDSIYLAFSGAAVVKAMAEAGRDHARFFIGAVIWQPGELADEVKQGAWYVMDATPELILPARTTGLWSTLVERAEMIANGI
jgi:putative transcriptional regulator